MKVLSVKFCTIGDYRIELETQKKSDGSVRYSTASYKLDNLCRRRLISGLTTDSRKIAPNRFNYLRKKAVIGEEPRIR